MAALPRRAAIPGAMAVEPRTMRSGMKVISASTGFSPLIAASSVEMAARQIASTGWRTVVSGGCVIARRGESS